MPPGDLVIVWLPFGAREPGWVFVDEAGKLTDQVKSLNCLAKEFRNYLVGSDPCIISNHSSHMNFSVYNVLSHPIP